MLPTRAQWEPTGHPKFTQALTGSLSFSGAITPLRNRLLDNGLSFQNLLTDWAPRATTGWTLLGSTTHFPSNFRGGPMDAGFDQTSATSADLTAPATQMNISPKVAIGATDLVTVFAHYKDNAGSGSPFELAILIYSAADVLLGWWATQWGNHTVGYEQAIMATPELISTQAKAAVAWRSAVSGVNVNVKAFSISANKVSTIKLMALKVMTGAVSFSGAVTSTVKHTQSLSGAVSFSGAILKMVSKPLTGNLTFSGAVTKAVGRLMTANATFSGALTKRTSKTFTGNATFSGAVATMKVSLLSLSGQVSFAGAFVKRIGKPFTSGVSFSGAFVKSVARSLTGSLTFTSVFSKSVSKLFTALVSFAGTQTRRVGKALTGAVSFSGAFVKKTIRSFAANLTFSGAMVPQIITTKFQSMTGSVSFSGGLVKKTAKNLTANLTFSGLNSLMTKKALSGAVSFSGALLKAGRKTLLGNLTFSSTFIRTLPRAFTGNVTFATLLATIQKKFFFGSVSFSGTLKQFFVWIEIQARVRAVFLTMRHSLGALMAIRHDPSTIVFARIKGAQEVAYKRGTNIQAGCTFTDPDSGNQFDPDVGSVKLYVKFVNTGAYLTGYDRATGGKAMAKIAVGEYETDVQFQLTDAIGQYEVEMEGFVGTKRFLDSVKVSVKA